MTMQLFICIWKKFQYYPNNFLALILRDFKSVVTGQIIEIMYLQKLTSQHLMTFFAPRSNIIKPLTRTIGEGVLRWTIVSGVSGRSHLFVKWKDLATMCSCAFSVWQCLCIFFKDDKGIIWTMFAVLQGKVITIEDHWQDWTGRDCEAVSSNTVVLLEMWLVYFSIL